MRLFLSSLTLGIGYLLVYAAFHPDGPAGKSEYARRPWRSLLLDKAARQAVEERTTGLIGAPATTAVPRAVGAAARTTRQTVSAG